MYVNVEGFAEILFYDSVERDDDEVEEDNENDDTDDKA